MSIPASREQHKEWCLRQLGFPVLEINVDDDQVDDAVDQSIQYFQDFHFNADIGQKISADGVVKNDNEQMQASMLALQ